MPVLASGIDRADRADPSDRADPRGTNGRSFLRACVLLLLRERSAHGYELLERLERFGFDAGDSGWLYRTLRALEREHHCLSAWESSPAGPRRRTYHLTPIGEEALASSADLVRTNVRAMETYLDRYVVASRTRVPPPRLSTQGRPEDAQR